ncbi:MAG TPA: AAA family ATPase [Gemmatimonadaceae bacterium]
MPLFHIQSLGDVRLTRESGQSGQSGEPVALRRKPLALLAYLARRAPRVVPRSELTTLLWGERAEERARQSLRQALLELRQAVGDAIEVTPDGVRLGAGAVALDLADFERDAREGRDEQAAAAWRGEFFPNAAEIGGDGFERWVESERTTALRRLGAVMERLVGGAELRADWDAAAGWAARWAAAAPFDERAHARLVETLRMRGRAEEALERHADFVARLRAELDVEPSPEFLRLAGGLAQQARSEAARRARPSTGMRVPALVGRGHELAELAAAWRSAVTGAHALVLVDDDGGGGKTRLCDELERLAGEHAAGDTGAVVLRASGVAGDDAEGAADADGAIGAPRYATARALFAGLGDAPGSAGASPEALAECARLVPSLGRMFRHLPAPSGDEGALRDGLVQLLAAVADETPVLLLLDDAHCADAASLRLLAAVAARLPGGVAMVLFGDASGRADGAGLDALLAVPGFVRIRLHPLGAHEVEAMLASMANVAEADRRVLAARLHAETLGVPLLVHETVAALVDERLLALDHAGEWRVSPSLDGRPLPLSVTVLERCDARLATLSPHARTVLETAAVLGTPIDGVLLEAVAGLAPDDAAAGLRELAARRLVREDPATGEVDFGHPVLGRAAYALLPPSERQAHHARAAAELAARDLTTTAERSVLPYHLARAGTPRATPRGSAAVAGIGGADGSESAPAPRRSMLARRLSLAAAGLVAIAALTPGVLWVIGRVAGTTGAFGEGSIAPDAHRVMVGSFENRSGRAELDRLRDVAVDWVVRGLDETGLVEIVGAPAAPAPGERGGAAVLAADDRLRAAARAAHVGTIVTGTFDQRGDTVVLEAMLVNARDGSLLRALPPVRAGADDPLPGVDRLRHEVVGALAALVDPRYDPGDGARAPPSYEAYLAMIRGEEAASSGARDRAVNEYRKAAAADSTYVLPLLRLAITSFDAGRCERVDSIVAVLGRRRVSLSRYEGHYLDRVAALCRGDWEGANDAARRMADLSPRSQRAQFAAALSAASVNRPREALRRLEAMDPWRGWVPADGRYWTVLAFVQHMAGDDAGLRALRGRIEGAPRDFFTVTGVAYAAAALGRAAEVERAASELIAIGRRTEATRLTILLPMLDELRVHGGAADAEAVSARLAAQIGAGVPPGPAADTVRYVQAELLYRAGRWADARAIADELLVGHAGSIHVVALAGRAAARLGDGRSARQAFDALDGLAPPPMRGADSYVRAQIVALLGEPEAAVRLLQRAVAEGVPYTPDLGTAYLGHADIDLASVIDDPAVRMMLARRD